MHPSGPVGAQRGHNWGAMTHFKGSHDGSTVAGGGRVVPPPRRSIHHQLTSASRCSAVPLAARDARALLQSLASGARKCDSQAVM